MVAGGPHETKGVFVLAATDARDRIGGGAGGEPRGGN